MLSAKSRRACAAGSALVMAALAPAAAQVPRRLSQSETSALVIATGKAQIALAADAALSYRWYPSASDQRDRFARDEPGGAHDRGAVALATHGADTADLQFFVDLAGAPQWNREFTVLAYVTPVFSEDPIDRIVEGSRILTIRTARGRFLSGTSHF